MRTALTIAGSDSCGGAGIQADLKAFMSLGVHGMSVITAVTAQNTRGVTAVHAVPVENIVQQIDAVAEDFPVHGLKTGMLATAEVIHAVASAIRRHRFTNYVCDPVMFAKSGDRLLEASAVDALKAELLPLATIVTPNRKEAAALAGMDAAALDEPVGVVEACHRIITAGANAVVIKAVPHGDRVVDVMMSATQGGHEVSSPLIEKPANHGSGCTFAALLAAGLALGHDLASSLKQANHMVYKGIARGVPHGKGTRAVNILAAME